MSCIYPKRFLKNRSLLQISPAARQALVVPSLDRAKEFIKEASDPAGEGKSFFSWGVVMTLSEDASVGGVFLQLASAGVYDIQLAWDLFPLVSSETRASVKAWLSVDLGEFDFPYTGTARNLSRFRNGRDCCRLYKGSDELEWDSVSGMTAFTFRIMLEMISESEARASILIFPEGKELLDQISPDENTGENLENLPCARQSWGTVETILINAAMPEDALGLGVLPVLCVQETLVEGVELPGVTVMAKAIGDLLRSSMIPRRASVAEIKSWIAEAMTESSALVLASMDWRFKASKPEKLWTSYCSSPNPLPTAAPSMPARDPMAAVYAALGCPSTGQQGQGGQACRKRPPPVQVDFDQFSIPKEPLFIHGESQLTDDGVGWNGGAMGGSRLKKLAGCLDPSNGPAHNQEIVNQMVQELERSDANMEPPAKASRVEGSFAFNDDGHAALGGMHLRAKLRPPNLAASRWWDDQSLGLSPVTLPVRGSSLYLGDIVSNKSLNPKTVILQINYSCCQ